MNITQISVNRANIAQTQQQGGITPRTLTDGEIRVEVEEFGLSSNNISYAATGDMLGYWAHFSTEDTWGVVPVWGFARVTESKCAQIAPGERIFGYLPMASQHIFKPSDVSALCFSDASPARAQLHPWYTRLYRCEHDPAFDSAQMAIQQSLWALFMTGWMMAQELKSSVDGVLLSSASSKTAISLAWALKQDDIYTVGFTSAGNKAFVESLDIYSQVLTYDNVQVPESISRAAYVDFAGNAQVTSDMHVVLDHRLVDSILIGGTHRAPSAEPLPMPGPAPRFFFIPDVAEAAANKIGFENYHDDFAKHFSDFVTWAAAWIEVDYAGGADAVEAGYAACSNGSVAPNKILSFTW
ncbi:MAG: DUF2855 family protein [Pseudomonadota bacterium]